MTRELQKATGSSKYNCERLVRTETARAVEDATLQSYRDCGVEEYEISAALDGRTCRVCGRQDGKVYRVEEARTGLNYPPLHANCRCTTLPVIEGLPEEGGLRAARDGDGGYMLVPGDMTYEQWKDGLNRSGEDGIIAKKSVGEASDVRVICNINTEIYRRVSADMDEDRVVITDERIDHIKYRHPMDWEVYGSYLAEVLQHPTLILSDKNSDTAIVLKSIVVKDEIKYLRATVRLHTPRDEPGFMNSVLTFQKNKQKRIWAFVKKRIGCLHRGVAVV